MEFRLTKPPAPAEPSFETLVHQCRPMLVDYLSALLGDVHRAEDLAQETLLTADRIFDRFEQGGNFGAWLRGIARNKIREHRRSIARRPLMIDSRVLDGMEEVLSIFDTPAGVEERWGGRLGVLRTCIGKLKSGLRAAIEAVYFGDHSLKEAAIELGASPAAVGKRLSRARALLKQCADLQLSKGQKGSQP
ncbi:MAG: sigma-70 family RNA polymerase sigma factor [Verrucomicrobiae bacterium]|nr:sigma-70 family RNA polymerase sigma factor [Verrucomicrobiae bacterium]NNJ43861.1 sigma-70 family RNA polymerase sigma factor [Akkermansiaceae bacterium]